MKYVLRLYQTLIQIAVASILFNSPAYTQNITPEMGNFIFNPEFDRPTYPWFLKTFNGAIASKEILTDSSLSGKNALVIHCKNGGTRIADIQLSATDRKYFIKGCYSLEFMAKSDVPHTIKIEIKEIYLYNRVVWESPEILITDKPQHFGPYIYHHRIENGGYKINFQMGGRDSVNVMLDSVSAVMTMDPEELRLEECFIKRSHTYGETTIPYHLYVPKPLEDSLKYPIILSIHGSDQDAWFLEHYYLFFRFASVWADSANQAELPCFVLAPNYLLGMSWWNTDWIITHGDQYSPDVTPMTNALAAVSDLLTSLIREFPIDTNRIYITGLSEGGSATWDLISRYPHRFAAAIPMAGISDSSQVHKLLHLPIWNFHGGLDETISVELSRQTASAFEHAGRPVVYTHSKNGVPIANPDSVINSAIANESTLLYTEYPGGKHGNCIDGYDFPQLLLWAFSQSKKRQSGIAVHEPGLLSIQFSLSQNYPNPFNPTTRFLYTINQKSRVTLKVFNTYGQQVAVLKDEVQSVGTHSVIFDGSCLSSGVYLLKMTVEGNVLIRKMILMR